MVDPTPETETLGILPFHIAYGFAAVLAVFLATGSITRLISPRFVPLAWVALAGFVVLGLAHRWLSRLRAERRSIGYLGFLGLLMVLPGAFINDTSLAGINGIDLAGARAPSSAARPANIGNEWADGIASKIGRSGPDSGEFVLSTGIVELTDTDYYRIYNDIYDRREAYLGREVTLTGFVNKDESISDGGRFLVGRMVMWCCAADAYMIGFIVLGGSPDSVSAGSWVTVRGTIGETQYVNPMNDETYTVPAVELESIEPMATPDSPYVAPVF